MCQKKQQIKESKLLCTYGAMWFWLAHEEDTWLDWLIGNEIVMVRINLKRHTHE